MQVYHKIRVAEIGGNWEGVFPESLSPKVGSPNKHYLSFVFLKASTGLSTQVKERSIWVLNYFILNVFQITTLFILDRYLVIPTYKFRLGSVAGPQ